MVAYASSWTVKNSKVMTQNEIDTVLADLTPKAMKSHQALIKLLIFRLTTFCGLRVTEMSLLNIEDIYLNNEQPYIRIRAETAKGKKGREVPIYSEATVSEVKTWLAIRATMGASKGDPLLVSVSRDSMGHRFSRQGARNRFRAACKALGEERAKSLTIHAGRHTAISQLLEKSVPIAIVRNLAGHSSISVTNIYTGIFHGRQVQNYNID